MTAGRADITRGPTSLAEMARLTGEFAGWHNIVYSVVWLTGKLDIAAVREAWRGVCLRNDILRRTYLSSDEACTYDDMLGELEFYAADSDAEALNTIRRFVEPPFDLAGLGLSRIAIVQRDEYRHLFAIALDHVIVDFVTWNLLMRDFAELYDRAARGASLDRKVEQNAYHDFAVLERRKLSGAWGEKRRAFWQAQAERFGMFPPPFPIDCEPQGEPSSTLVQHELPKDAEVRFLDLARRARATPFATAAAAVLAGVQEATGTSTVGASTNYHGRVLPGTSDIAGLFVQKLPLHLTTRSRHPEETVHEVFSHSLDVFEYSLPLWSVGQLWNENLAHIDREAGVQVGFGNQRTTSFGESLLTGITAETVFMYVPGQMTWPQTIQIEWQLGGTTPQIIACYNQRYFPGELIQTILQTAENFVLSTAR
ncbi:condensation domain-containing protein [Streptomyces sp. NPDC050617]|uniref:condensation domain-containing protein n=1 Tax=Streptomyces sp. NPDC050617 TaxID=3154628 RepID=UPI003412EBA9